MKFTRGRMESVFNLWFLDPGFEPRQGYFFLIATNGKVSEIYMPYSGLNRHWMQMEIRLKSTFRVTMQSPLNHHSVIIASSDISSCEKF